MSDTNDNIKDRFEGLPDDQLDTLLNDAESTGDVQAAAAPKPPVSGFVPKTPNKQASAPAPVSAPASIPGEVEAKAEAQFTKQRLADLEATIKMLLESKQGLQIKQAAIVHAPLDWTKVTEKSVFDFDIPIETFDHALPDYMNITLKDGNYVPRWVQKMPRRLGPMKAKGFVYVKAEDIEGELNIAIEADENGVFRFDDVILMKIEKRRYYGMLRENHTRAINMVDPKKAHLRAKDQIVKDMQSATAGEKVDGKRDQTVSGDFQRYVDKKQIDVYSPHFEL